MAIEHGMDRADGGAMDFGIALPQPFPDLGRPPGRFVLLQSDDQRLDLEGKLVGMTVGSTRAICPGFKATAVVALEKLVAGLAGDAELPAQPCHLLPVQE